MSKKGTYTDKKIMANIHIGDGKWEDKEVTVGKISGNNGNGIPVYDLTLNGAKVGELQAIFIKSKLNSNKICF